MMNTFTPFSLKFSSPKFLISQLIKMICQTSKAELTTNQLTLYLTRVGNWKFNSHNSLLVVFFLFIFGVESATGVTKTWTGGTNWSWANNWSPSGIPSSGDNVIIPKGFSVTVDVAAACNSLTFTEGGTSSLSVNNGVTLAVTNAVAVNDANTTNSAANIQGSGTLTCASVNIGDGTATNTTTLSEALNSSISTFTISGNLNINSYQPTYNIIRNSSFTETSGTVTVNGQITTSNNYGTTSTFTLGNSSPTLNLDGSSPFLISGSGTNTITLNGIGATVNYNMNGAQTVYGNNYTNLTLSGSGLKTLKTSTSTIGGNLTLSGSASTVAVANLSIGGNINISTGTTFDLATYTANRSTNGGTLTVAGTMLLGLDSGGQSGSNFPLNYSTTTLTGGTVNYNQAWGGQTIYSGSTYSNLILGNSSNSQTASGNLTVSGTLTTTAGGGLNMGTYTLNVGAVNNSGTIETQNTSATPFTSGLTWGGTVLINGSSSQTIPASTFNNLIITNGNGVSLGGNITVNGTLTLNGGQLTLGSRNLTLGEASPAVAGYNMTVITNGTGSLRKIFTSPGSYVFPVADAAGVMSYLTLNFVSGTFAAGAYASVQVVNAKEPNLGSTTNYLNKYWTIGQSGITGFSSTVTGSYRSWADIVPANTESNLSAARYANSSWTYYSALSSNTLTATGVTTFGNFTGIPSPCSYNSTDLGGIATYTPVINMPNKIQTLSTTFTSGQYFVMNVIKGLTYQVYTTSAPNAALKMTVYEEGNPSGSILASSISNTGNPGSTNTNNVYLSFTSPLSGQVRVMISLQSDCSSTTTIGLTVKANVSGGSNTQDDPTGAGTDTWIGHVYDGTSFNNYIGYYNVTSLSGMTDQFQESFGTGGTWPNNNSDDASTFNIISNSVVRAQELEQTYSVHYRMNSTKRGFYTVSIASDDGVRLTVDNTKVYEDWTTHAPKVDNTQLISLSGSSALLLDYYEANGQNIIGFYNLVQIFSNTLTTNANQTVCKGTSGQVISGDSPTLQSGITNPTYKWYYSTANAPSSRIILTGATSPTYTPNSNLAPFNVSGTYYLYRIASLTSANNLGATSNTQTNESNAAIIKVRSCPNYWIGSTNVTTGTSWQTAANWSDGIPGDGDNIAFAATTNTGNNGQDAVNDLILDNYYTVGDMTNNSGRKLIISVGTGLTVNGAITTNDVVGDNIYIKSEPEKINGTLIFHNPSTSSVYATVEMYSKATINTSGPTDYQYFWQYFGVPLTTVIAEPTLYGAYVRRANEAGNTDDTTYYWTELTNSSELKPFIGHEICQPTATTYIFKGQLVNTDFDSGSLAYTIGATYPGQHLFANPYTAAINVDKIEFGSDLDKTVFLYNTGSYGNWNTSGYQTSSGENPGQYLSIPQNVAGSGGIPGEVPSMSSMLVKTGGNGTAGSYIKIKYSDVATKNTSKQRVKSVDAITNTDLISTRIDLTGKHYSDRMWIFTEPSCTRNFDNGWDGRKILGSSLAPQIYAIEPDGDYQVNSVSDMNNTDLAFQAGDEVEYTLKFTHENIQRLYAGVYLVDLIENKTVDVSQDGSTYTFATAQSDVPAKRFKILTRPYEKGAPDKEAQVKIFTAPGRVFVHNFSTSKGECTLYDIAGRAIKNAPFAANAVTEVLNHLTPGAYVVNTITNGEKVSKRVIVQ